MSHHTADIKWACSGNDFTRGRYSRGHEWHFDGGVTVPASASPHVVRLPWSVEAAVDPEEALVAAISSCHMLWFLSLAREDGWNVVSYNDHAVGTMGLNERGREAILSVLLDPHIAFRDRLPSADEVTDLHHRAHENCFIANSVTCKIETRGSVRLEA
jgi:organic hydroperoxide reductase OsmC/OhrA